VGGILAMSAGVPMAKAGSKPSFVFLSERFLAGFIPIALIDKYILAERE
jgi:hypothetical protein